MLLREDGQILPGLAVLLGVTLALGVLFFQVGKASILRSDAQNAADAAALAGAQEIQRQLEAQYARAGFTDPTVVDPVAVVAKMREYARKNGGELVRQDLNLLAVDVRAWVVSEDELGGDAEPADRKDFQAEAKARAQVQLGPFSLGDPGGAPVPAQGGVPGGGIPRVTPDEWDALRKRIGPAPRDCPDVVALGLLLVRKGFMVWQNAHPALGGDAGHEGKPQSNHHACNDMGALDVNFGRAGDNVPEEIAAVEPLLGPLHELGYSTIWQAPGHYNHIHIDIGGGGGFGSGGFGFAGPLDHTGLLVKLVDWEKPVTELIDPGGSFGTTSQLGGKPDEQIMRLMCQMAKPLGPKILLATFETALVESGIHNLDYGDADSHGVFQQQWTQGWGTLADTMHPPTATRMFLDAALAMSKKYPNVSAGQLAALVQRPREDLEYKYDANRDRAAMLINRYCT
jgi:hypothetical protein